METRANYVLVGAFTLAGFLGILGFLLWFADYRVDQQFAYYDVHFSEVSGVGIGADVRFAGLKVGQVVDMRISPEQGGVRVRLEVTAGTPIKTDSTASIEPQGVTGLSFVGVTAGSPDAPLLLDEVGEIPVIRAGQSVLQTLGAQGPEIIGNLNTVTVQLTELLGEQNQQRVHRILENLERSSTNLDRMMADVSDATRTISEVAGQVAGFGSSIEGLSQAAQTTLANADATLANADTTLTTFTETATNADAALGDLRGYISGGLTETTAVIGEGAERVTALADRAGTTLDGVDSALETGQNALTAAESAFQGADRAINEELGPVVTDLRLALQGVADIADGLRTDLPAIMARIESATESARVAFGQLAALASETRAPVAQFAGSGLVDISRAARAVSEAARSIDQAVTVLQRRLR